MAYYITHGLITHGHYMHEIDQTSSWDSGTVYLIRFLLYVLSLKVSYFQNEFMKSLFLPKIIHEKNQHKMSYPVDDTQGQGFKIQISGHAFKSFAFALIKSGL